MALACNLFHDNYKVFPKGTVIPPFNNTTDPPFDYWSWQAQILPYMEQGNLYQESYTFAKQHANSLGHANPWYPPNPGLSVKVELYTCPSDSRSLVVQTVEGYNIAFTSYLGVSGYSAEKPPPPPNTTSQDGILFVNSRIRMRDIRDGSSNTLLIGERPPSSDLLLGWCFAGAGYNEDGLRAGDTVLGTREYNYAKSVPVWDPAKGEHRISCPTTKINFQPGMVTEPCDEVHFWSLHPSGANFALADGSVRLIAYSADPLLPALATRAGSETVGDY
jgi:prepilin-type processing-associated H-X9-DG protein